MINLVYPIYIKDKRNYHIAVDAISPISGEKGINIIFVINGLSAEYEQIISLADNVIYRDKNNIAGAWNDGLNLLKNLDYVLFVNQDITLSVDDVNTMHDAMFENDFVTHNMGMDAFSCFGGQVKSFQEVGAFDESFVRYHEDNDYYYRMRLVGKYLHSCGLKLHHVGSSVIKFDDIIKSQNSVTFQEGVRYYVKKWGGYKGREQFKTPFNK